MTSLQPPRGSHGTGRQKAGCRFRATMCGIPWPSCLLKPGLWDGDEFSDSTSCFHSHFIVKRLAVSPLTPLPTTTTHAHCIAPWGTVHMVQPCSAQPSRPGETVLATCMQRRLRFLTFSEADLISSGAPPLRVMVINTVSLIQGSQSDSVM